MLEAVLSEVLERVLGRYVRGIDRFRRCLGDVGPVLPVCACHRDANCSWDASSRCVQEAAQRCPVEGARYPQRSAGRHRERGRSRRDFPRARAVQLNVDALQELDLPLLVTEGFVGSLTIQVT